MRKASKTLKIWSMVLFFSLALVQILGGQSFGGETLPFHLTVVDSTGKEMSLDFLEGRKVVLAVYTTSMPDCKKHIGSFVRLSKDLEDTGVLFSGIDINPLGFEMFVRNLPDNRGKVLFRKDKGARLGRILGIRIIPTTFFVSEEGRIVERIESQHTWDSEEFKERVNKFVRPGKHNLPASSM